MSSPSTKKIIENVLDKWANNRINDLLSLLPSPETLEQVEYVQPFLEEGLQQESLLFFEEFVWLILTNILTEACLKWEPSLQTEVKAQFMAKVSSEIIIIAAKQQWEHSVR